MPPLVGSIQTRVVSGESVVVAFESHSFPQVENVPLAVAFEKYDPARTGKFWDEIKVGDFINEHPHHTFVLKEEEVLRFAKLTRDENPVHVDFAYAARSLYRKPIAHGALLASLVIGQYHKTRYTYGTLVAQTRMITHFFQPAYAGEELYVNMVVAGKDPGNHPKRGFASYDVWLRRVCDHKAVLYVGFEVLVLRLAAAKLLYRLGLTDELMAKRTFRSDIDPPFMPECDFPKGAAEFAAAG